MPISSPIKIELTWHGPEKWHSLKPKKCAGLYLWTVGESPSLSLSYVGESSDVRKRLRDHIIDLLGGGSWLWQIENLRANDLGVGWYEPDHMGNALFESYLTNIREHQELAISNLKEYSFFYAYHEDLTDIKVRKAVESALISDAQADDLYVGYTNNLKAKKKCLQNSRLNWKGPVVKVKSQFEDRSVSIYGITRNKWIDGITSPM